MKFGLYSRCSRRSSGSTRTASAPTVLLATVDQLPGGRLELMIGKALTTSELFASDVIPQVRKELPSRFWE